MLSRQQYCEFLKITFTMGEKNIHETVTRTSRFVVQTLQ